MTNETLLNIKYAKLLYSAKTLTITDTGYSQRDINSISDYAHKIADAYERACQESSAYEDKKQSLHWRVTAEKWHYKDNSDDSHRRTYYERVREYNHFVRKNGELGIIVAEPIEHILCAFTVFWAIATLIVNAIPAA